MFKSFRKTAQVFGVSILLATLAIIGLFFASNLSVVKLAKIKQLLPSFYVVQSGSMEPAIKTASLIATYRKDTYQVGDVITFTKTTDDTTLITHRVQFKTYPEGIHSAPVYLTAGDANEEIDSWQIPESQVTGKVVLTLPYVGYLVDFAKTPKGFILLVIVPATIIIYEELRSFLGEMSKSLKKLLNKASRTDAKRQAGLSKAAVALPLLGAGLVFLGLTAAYFTDTELSFGNIFAAAGSFTNQDTEVQSFQQEAVQTPTPTDAPDATQSAKLLDNDAI